MQIMYSTYNGEIKSDLLLLYQIFSAPITSSVITQSVV